MIRNLLFILIGMALSLGWCQANVDARPTVAVLDFNALNGLTASETQLISGRFESELLEDGRLRVLERSQMSAILSEQSFQQTGVCSSKDCQVEMGKMLGVTYIAVGNVGKLGTLYSINVKIVDVGSGEIKKSFSRDIDGGIEKVLTQACRSIAKDAGSLVVGSAAPVKSSEKTIEAESSGSNLKWWVTGGVAAIAAGVGVFVAVSSPDPKVTTIEQNRTTNVGAQQ